MPDCTCHEPVVFGHRCTGQPTGDMWPGNTTDTIEDARALLRRMNVIQQELAELTAAQDNFRAMVKRHLGVTRETSSWTGMVKALRRGHE